MVVTALSYKIEPFLHKMPISLKKIVELKRRIIVPLPTDLIEGSVFRICSQSRLICLFISPSIVQFHDTLWSAFGLPRLPSFSLSASLCLLHLSVLSKTQHQITFSLNAGATKEVNSPAAHWGIWHGASANKSWLHSANLQKSFAEI